ncbi:glucosaminidase domain-containing protein [Clostridioides difficile]
MKNNIRYRGLNSYILRKKRFQYNKLCIVILVTVLILFIIATNLKRDIYNEVSNLEEGGVIETKENVDSTIEKEVYSNSYIDEEKAEFLKVVSMGAINSYNKYGVLPSITIAQAILESGWGKSELAVTHNNLFGIKADSRWSGAIATISTNENYNDSIIANFRKYNSINESIEDHGKFLYENSRYAEYGLFNAKDYKEQAQALEDAGYSTVQNENGIPIYADKLISVIEKYSLMQYDQ